MSNSWHNLEAEWHEWDETIKQFREGTPERIALIEGITALWIEIAELTKTFQKEINVKDPAVRYYGLDPLKITALKVTQDIETGEIAFVSDYLQLAHGLILGNIIKHRLFGVPIKELQTSFSPAELTHFAQTIEHLKTQQETLEATKKDLNEEIRELRQEYEEFLFAESSHEAARSFGSETPNIGHDRHSWDAFAQFLTSVSLKLREEHKPAFVKRCRKIEAKRQALFESSAGLLAKLDAPIKDARRVQKQLQANLTEIKRLEEEIEATIAELDVPGLGDQSAFVVKKTPEQATTFGPNKTRQNTGDKT